MNHEVNPVDEIQVLQEWANAVPTPSQELTDRVKERVESAIREGVDRRVAVPVSNVRVGRNRWSVAGALAVAACVALVAILLAQSSPNPSPRLSQPLCVSLE
jgi:ferric-dicitrate binding protein FerR (iron transport regulator)